MTPEHWKEIEAVFNAALELPEQERAEFLSSAGDPQLRVEVEKLLHQYDEADSFISQPFLRQTSGRVLSSLFDDSDEDPMTGKMLGSYRIEREIGRGGMGAVYEAVRADGEFRRRVAIKVVKRGIDTDFVLRRFRNERQILAALDHPFITRLIDGGSTEDGRPYFVMDYIDGQPLYRFADQNRLTISQRLELFARICEAVEYAHQKRVIHRDLKPSNIFVTDDASPRLLDFGIAKLLDPEMSIDTLQPTATALRMMTIDYASPEQIRGDKVTFATDVYSLGIVLFELLTGRKPYKTAGGNPHDLAKEICDRELPLASKAFVNERLRVVGARGNGAPIVADDLAARRGETVEKVVGELRANIDQMIKRALRKDPEQRYKSVAAFREDILKHLQGGKVEDAPSEPLYSAEIDLSVAPNTKLVAVLPLQLLSPSGFEDTDASYLTIGLADSIIMRLTSVRQLMVRPTSSITHYSEEKINPFRAGAELGVDYVIDGRIRRFGDRLRVSLQLLDVKKRAAIWAGHFDECLKDVLELEDAISAQVVSALVPQLTGDEKRRLAKRGTDDPRAYEAYLRGRFFWNQFTTQSIPKAIEAFNRAVEIDPKYAMAYVGIADFYIWANIYGLVPTVSSVEEAEKAARRAVELDDSLGEAYASLALIHTNRYEFQTAEKLMLRAIELSPNYTHAWEWYAALLISTGRFREGLAATERMEQLDPQSLRTKTLVAWNLYQTGELEKALETIEEIIRLDPKFPQGHLQRGYVLTELGRSAEAVESIELARQLMPGSALVDYHYSFALRAEGRMDDVREIVDKMEANALTSYVKPLFLGYAHLAAGNLDQALNYFEQSVDECDPWVVWFGTEAKLRELRKDTRFTLLFERTGNPIIRKLRRGYETGSKLIDTGDYDPATSSESELPTRAYRSSFLRRNALSFSAAAVLVLIAGIVAYFGYLGLVNSENGGIRGSIKTLALLPLANETGNTEYDFLCHGIVENLTDRLTVSTDLRVISPSAAIRYQGRDHSPQAVGSKVGADAVFSGSIRREDGDLLVVAALTRVSDGRQIASFEVREKEENIVALQNQVVQRLTPLLGGSIVTRRETPQATSGNSEAFELYLKGEFHRQKATPADTMTAVELYQRAVQLDPDFALAFQGLALAYRSAPAYGTLSPQTAYQRAREAAQKALSLDPNLSTPYVTLASIKATYDWDFPGAEAQYKSSITLNPNNPEARYSYGNFLVAMGRTDEALSEFRYAQQFDPLSQNIATNIAWALYIAGRYEEAATQVRQVIDRDPNFARAYLNLGEILQEQGRFNEAVAMIERARSLSKDPIADMALGHAFAVAGRRAEAEAIVHDLETKVRSGEVSPFLPAVVYAGLDEKDKAFYWLERAFQERSNWLTLIKVGRRMKNLHRDPRFDDLLKRIGLY